MNDNACFLHLSGLSVFEKELSGCNVVVFSDNVGAQKAVEKGGARAWDHSCVVQGIWLRALRMRTGMWIERVASKDNISDLPSREEYDLMQKLKAQWREPWFHSSFLQPQAWQHLCL